MSFRTSCQLPDQNPGRSVVVWTGRMAGDSNSSVTGSGAGSKRLVIAG